MTKIALCLSGCGVNDGAEITEAVCSMLALDQAGAEIVYCAPDIDQSDVVNHLKGEPAAGESRNVLAESARIARGEIVSLSELNIDDCDAIIFPGGFGAAKNLCDFAMNGPECNVNPDVEKTMLAFHEAGKPIGVMCIAPALLARVFGAKGLKVEVTIGNDAGVAGAIEKMGCLHKDCTVDDVVVDHSCKVVSTPAYMLASGPNQAWLGISRLVGEVLRMCGATIKL